MALALALKHPPLLGDVYLLKILNICVSVVKTMIIDHMASILFVFGSTFWGIDWFLIIA